MSAKSTAKSGPKGIPAPKPRSSAAVTKAAEVEAPVAAEGVQPESAAGEGTASSTLKLRELVSRVVEATGAKKKGVKEIVEGTLVEIGAALLKGEELNLPGVGKVRVAKALEKDGVSLMTVKIRGAGGVKKKEPKEALADADEAV